MIKLFAGPQPPEGWVFCEGQALDRNTYPALFDLIGYRYGGQGDQFFLPQLPAPEMGRYVLRGTVPGPGEAGTGMVSQIALYLGEDEPEGWFRCDGRVLSAMEFPVLNKVMGRKHGGDGVSTVGLPAAPVQNGVSYLICVEGIDPTGGTGQDDDDDDY